MFVHGTLHSLFPFSLGMSSRSWEGIGSLYRSSSVLAWHAQLEDEESFIESCLHINSLMYRAGALSLSAASTLLKSVRILACRMPSMGSVPIRRYNST